LTTSVTDAPALDCAFRLKRYPAISVMPVVERGQQRHLICDRFDPPDVHQLNTLGRLSSRS
jgi:hypothetical protein